MAGLKPIERQRIARESGEYCGTNKDEENIEHGQNSDWSLSIASAAPQASIWIGWRRYKDSIKAKARIMCGPSQDHAWTNATSSRGVSGSGLILNQVT